MVSVHEHTQQDEGRYATADAHHLLQQKAHLGGGFVFRGFCLQVVIMLLLVVVVVRELLGKDLDEYDVDENS